MSGKQYGILIGGLLLIAVFLNLPRSAAERLRSATRDNLTPFHSVVLAVQRQARGLWWYVADAWRAPETEQTLRAENAQLRLELWRLRQVDEENRALHELAAFREKRRERLLIAEVIARGDTTGWWHSLRLNRGTVDGVRVDLPVITPKGLVGRTASVSRYTCDVLLITDPALQVSCRVGTENAFGILRGHGVSPGGDARLTMLYNAPAGELDYVSTELAVREGDEVRTSGLGGVYPAGVPVGRVQSVRLDPSQLYMSATVTPVADLSTMHYVFIMLKGAGES